MKSHGPKMVLLQRRLGINEKALGRLCLHAIRVLSYKLETLESKMDWLQARLNLDKTQLRKIIKRTPVTLTLSIEENIEPLLDIIQSGLELSDKELTKIVVKASELITHDLSAEKLALRCSFLQDILNIDENNNASLRRAVLQCPAILFYPEDKMMEIQHWIAERLGVSDTRIAQMFRNRPDCLVQKVKTLEERVHGMQAALSMKDEELYELFGKFPSLLILSPERNIVPKLRFLRLTLALNDEELKNLVTKRPSLFTRSEKDIEEKLQFYSELVGKSEAKRLVIKSSNLLTVSLKKRLRPRLAEVKRLAKKLSGQQH